MRVIEFPNGDSYYACESCASDVLKVDGGAWDAGPADSEMHSCELFFEGVCENLAAKATFPIWPQEIFSAGFRMGKRHAQTGDSNDHSEERCKPLEDERDRAAGHFSFGYDRAAFRGGYEAGYEFAMNE